jgi:hypothetical protein
MWPDFLRCLDAKPSCRQGKTVRAILDYLRFVNEF